MQEPSLPRGTRDFGPNEMIKREFIFSTIKKVFVKFGFQPMETPSIENLSVLTGKYGEEGDQMLFKILNSGDFLSGVSSSSLEEDYRKLTPQISNKGLRYDLTVPLARFVVNNRNNLTFPFKRYQLQPVWRADRPQKGRYREFYQCDADVVGTDSLICEAEIVVMIDQILSQLGIDDFTIKINSRKILNAIGESTGKKGKEAELFIAMDKLEKIGRDKVLGELQEKGWSDSQLESLKPFFDPMTNQEAINFLSEALKKTETGLQGVSEIKELLGYLEAMGFKNQVRVDFDPTLARGLSYYTGVVFEAKVNNVKIGSVSGGGRYDDLTGVFGLQGYSGTGISFGIDRLYDVMETLSLFPDTSEESTKVLIAYFDEPSRNFGLGIMAELRNNDISCEIYPDLAKLKKQLGYANRKGIPFVIVIGSEEMETGKLSLKNMDTGDQNSLELSAVIKKLN